VLSACYFESRSIIAPLNNKPGGWSKPWRAGRQEKKQALCVLGAPRPPCEQCEAGGPAVNIKSSQITNPATGIHHLKSGNQPMSLLDIDRLLL
jgi:hypothetical protein